MTVLVLAGAGGLCWAGAETAATYLEERTAEDVERALTGAVHDWAGVQTDGLQVRLTGTAPSEVARFRALTQAATAVDASRILDETTVAAVGALTPPDFKIELLRNEQGISLIGLVPAATDRAAILRDLRGERAAVPVTDLLESADYPLPPLWEAAMRFGLQALRMAGPAKISIAPGEVTVVALADNAQDKARLEAALQKARPEGVKLQARISAPRPVVSPYALRFVMNASGTRLDACVAEDQPTAARITEAARAAGLIGRADCPLGLGAPSPAWGDAAVAAIGALSQLGQGAVTLSDARIGLRAGAGVGRAQFDEVVAQLRQALPAEFALEARLETAKTDKPVPIKFDASLTDSGMLSMRGRIADAQMRQAVDSFARSRFQVAESGLRSDAQVPEGWTVRVIAALEAVGTLHSGQVAVTPELITLGGVSGDPHATDAAVALLTERLGPGARYDLAISYDRRLDPVLGLPDGEECVARLNRIMSESEIGFEPSRASIAGDPAPALSQLAEVMADCGEFQIEAGGHTDSQGSEGFNAELSRGRAQAIVAAMRDAGIDTTNMTSRGYGESQPLDSNETEEGREANRRIEFRLLSPRPVQPNTPPQPAALSGVTGAPPQVPPAAPMAGPDMEVLAAGRLQGPQMPPMQGPQLPQPAPPPPQMQGPQLPHSNDSPGMVPLTVGVSEEFQSLDEREENLRVPVQAADDTTPRPGARPEGVVDRAAAQDEASDP
ncbi:OmpA family protein [Paracoccus sp. T5]|uniref:OmpA family protein n=1 Tax=Paracoccus sp. T5 TaxID=3402161 RepID=UPI003AF94C78